MKRIATSALAVFLLGAASAASQHQAADRAAILGLMDKAFAAGPCDGQNGWRFDRRLQRAENFQSDD